MEIIKAEFKHYINQKIKGKHGALLKECQIEMAWRIVFNEDVVHFYQYNESKYSDHFPYDIQKIDMGIAVAHFGLSVKEKTIKGYFTTGLDPKLDMSKNTRYVFSWIKEVN